VSNEVRIYFLLAAYPSVWMRARRGSVEAHAVFRAALRMLPALRSLKRAKGQAIDTHTGQAKVAQRANTSARVKEEVSGLDVTVDEAASVDIA